MHCGVSVSAALDGSFHSHGAVEVTIVHGTLGDAGQTIAKLCGLHGFGRPRRGRHMSEHVSPENILRLGLAFWGSKTLLSAVELGVFTKLAGRSLDLEALRVELGLHPRSARDFFDALVSLGMLERKDGRYTNTPATEAFLDRKKPGYLGGFLDMANARLYGFWGGLTEGLRTGAPQNEVKAGGHFFAELYSDPARLENFLGAMTGLSRHASLAIARAVSWSDYKTVCDVGAALGDLLAQVALANPHITAVGFDLPSVGPVFESYVKSLDLASRVSFTPGDFFRDALPKADVITMGHIGVLENATNHRASV